MGWHIRKSVGFGPVRLNFSKSGVGAAVGVKGARVSVGPRGTYVHMGRYGIYYRERLDTPPGRLPIPRQGLSDFKGATGPEVSIPTADVSNLTDASAEAILDRINTAAQRIPFWPFAAVGALLLGGSLHQYTALAAVALAAGLISSLFLHTRDRQRRTTPLLYELSEEAERQFESMSQTFAGLARAQRLWQVVSSQQNFDWKRNAGASSFIRRTPAMLSLRQPAYIAANVSTWCLHVGHLELYFFPDRVLVKQGSRFGAVAYTNLVTAFAPSRYIEDAWVPSDAQVVGHTWRYVRRDGGPDRRFANNRQIPVVLYGLLQFQSSTGLDIHLHVSDQRLANWFVAAFAAVTASRTGYQRPRPTTRTASPEPRRHLPSDVVAAYETLDVPAGTLLPEVDQAFRNLAKLYHPDKVHHLAPEIRALAAARMTELNAAHDRIRHYYRVGASVG